MDFIRDRSGKPRQQARRQRPAATRATTRRPANNRRSIELINAIRTLILAIATLLGAATAFIAEIVNR
jgi:hypothetical protein